MSTLKQTAIDAIIQNKIVNLEFLNFFTGEFIGEGASRYVFSNPYDQHSVIKIDLSDWNANVIEFDVWQNIKDTPAISKWFAPVLKMSVCGRILIQQKVDMKRPRAKYPKKLPNFFADVKYSNFGFINRRCVCVDYASNYLYEKGMRVRLVNANY